MKTEQMTGDTRSANRPSEAGMQRRFWIAFPMASAALALYLLSPGLAPFELPAIVLGAVGFFLVSLRSPLGTLAAVLFFLPFYPVPGPQLASWSFPAYEIGLGITALAVIIREKASLFQWASKPRLRLDLRSALDLLAVALVFVALLSLLVSARLPESLRSLRLIIVEPVIFYFLLRASLKNQSDARRIVLALLLSGLMISLVGLYHYATNQNIITAEESLRRIRVYYGSPNNLALFFDRVIPFALALALLGWRRVSRLGFRSNGTGLVASATLAFSSVALLLTFSIGAWGATLISCLFVLYCRGRRAFTAGVAAIVGAFLIAAPFLAQLERVRSKLDLSDGTTFARIVTWEGALAMLRDHPIFGIGLDNFLYYYRDLKYMPEAGWREPNLSHPHNFFLDFWLSLGLPGLIVGLLIIGLVLVLGVRLISSRRGASSLAPDSEDSVGRALVVGALGALVATLAHGSIDNSFFLPDLAMLFWLGSAIVRTICSGNLEPGATVPEEDAA